MNEPLHDPIATERGHSASDPVEGLPTRVKGGHAGTWAPRLWQHRTWLVVGLILIFSASVRLRLLQIPLERDEGEYAYAGQLILQGIPPYKLAYNMKFPGTYAAYAAIMGIFGQSVAGIHLGLTMVNLLSIVLVFLLSRKWLDEAGALVATLVFALMSINPSFLALAGHATHFVVVAALGGILLALREVNRSRPWPIFGSGCLFGLAVLMKQHGIVFAAFAALHLAWTRVTAHHAAASANRSRSSRRSRQPFNWLGLAREWAVFGAGVCLPYVLTCLWLWRAGVFKDFVFWTITYAGKYVSSVPASEAPAYLRVGVGAVFWGNPLLWLLAGCGAVIMWWDDRLAPSRLVLTALALCSVAAVSAGFYFREHYFILLLPALALLSGAAVSRSVRLLRKDRSIELFLAVPVLLLLLVGIGAAFVLCSPVWFAPGPEVASQRIYGSTLFSEVQKAADYIRAESKKEVRLAVLGSEPELYFLAQRKSVTGFIYMYPLMEAHPYALKMQEQLIADLERERPEYVVFVNDPMSWLSSSSSKRKIFDWWDNYWTSRYDLVRSQKVINEVPAEFENLPDDSSEKQTPTQDSFLLVLKRKTDSPSERAGP